MIAHWSLRQLCRRFGGNFLMESTSKSRDNWTTELSRFRRARLLDDSIPKWGVSSEIKSNLHENGNCTFFGCAYLEPI